MTPAQLDQVKNAIESIRAATGGIPGLFENSETRDGSACVLWFDEGRFYLVIHGGPHLGSYSYPKLGLAISGYLFNDDSKLVEALTLHQAPLNEVTLSVALEDDYLEQVTQKLIPKVREHALRVREQWAREARRKANVQATLARFGMAASPQVMSTEDVQIEASVYSYGSDPDDLRMRLTLGMLRPDQAAAILALLQVQPAIATA